MLYNLNYFKLNKDMKANVDLFQCHKQTEPVYCTIGNWYTWWSVYCYEYKLTNVQEGPHYERRVVYFFTFQGINLGITSYT